jgi:hypothetical protein
LINLSYATSIYASLAIIIQGMEKMDETLKCQRYTTIKQ